MLLGFPPERVLAMLAANLMLQIIVHTQWVARLPGPIEWLFNASSNHRAHHGRNPRYIDRDPGGVFMFRDDICPGPLALRLKHSWRFAGVGALRSTCVPVRRRILPIQITP